VSDEPQGRDWWQASNGKFYPPSVAPGLPPPPIEDVELSAESTSKIRLLVTSGTAAPENGGLNWAIVISGLLVAGSTLMSWLTASIDFGTVNRNAFQLGIHESLSSTGPIALLLGLLMIGIGIARLTNSKMPQSLQQSPVVIALGVCADLGLQYSGLQNWVRNSESPVIIASIGTGYWICCAGAILGVVAGAGQLRRGDFISVWTYVKDSVTGSGPDPE
jgi:hypothetical protein